MAVGEFFFTPLVLFIVPKYCHDEFFVNFNFFHVACLKIALSKCLGYIIVLLAPIIKFPQILKVLRASSVEGLSLVGFVTELATQTVTFSYNSARGFPFRSVSQITENFRNGHTGQLSFIMVLLLLFTHAARIFTTMQETGDQYILAIFTLSTVFNITMVTQILYYWNATIDAQKKKE
ncbi:mannose-P-dolichol utilization defect 1 protein-like [Pocillopora damicornis]|uniref:mannose-P-dolichol utilization defect 1 protein-like n=1 Tax=Pocillopora damicornis TaxID=46731 RepID=UPI000F5516D9|nr:mannose-P-dolichol utilization defect 1 protein-like [Pocillopora damicornis]